MTYEEYLKSIYYDPKHPGSFRGVEKLYQAVKRDGKYVLSRYKIKKWLQKQETFTLHSNQHDEQLYVQTTYSNPIF